MTSWGCTKTDSNTDFGTKPVGRRLLTIPKGQLAELRRMCHVIDVAFSTMPIPLSRFRKPLVTHSERCFCLQELGRSIREKPAYREGQDPCCYRRYRLVNAWQECFLRSESREFEDFHPGHGLPLERFLFLTCEAVPRMGDRAENQTRECDVANKNLAETRFWSVFLLISLVASPEE
jgi:hypothetical protein